MQTEDNKAAPGAMQEQLAFGRRVAAAATVLTILLAVGKGIAGRWCGSPALTADAVHAAADMLAIVMLLGG